jgi:hypothetical protein
MASELRVNTLKDASGNNSVATSTVAEGTAKAWAHCDMDGDDAFQQSFNFASITDNGNGDHEFNFTNNMSYGDYAIGGANGNGQKSSVSVTQNRPAVSTTSAYKFVSLAITPSSIANYDADDISATIHGDLA